MFLDSWGFPDFLSRPDYFQLFPWVCWLWIYNPITQASISQGSPPPCSAANPNRILTLPHRANPCLFRLCHSLSVVACVKTLYCQVSQAASWLLCVFFSILLMLTILNSLLKTWPSVQHLYLPLCLGLCRAWNKCWIRAYESSQASISFKIQSRHPGSCPQWHSKLKGNPWAYSWLSI